MPTALRSSIVAHMCMVHENVRDLSKRFQEQLRRYNYVTPKNYLDFVNTYKRSLGTERQARIAPRALRGKELWFRI